MEKNNLGIRRNGENYFSSEQITVGFLFAADSKFAAIPFGRSLDVVNSESVVLAVDLGTDDPAVLDFRRRKTRVRDRDHKEVVSLSELQFDCPQGIIKFCKFRNGCCLDRIVQEIGQDLAHIHGRYLDSCNRTGTL